jgi:Fe-S oxidoreductase
MATNVSRITINATLQKVWDTTKKLYFNPGCALSIYKPEQENKIFEYLKENYPDIKLHKICCKHNPLLEQGTIINVCAGCDKRFSTLYEHIDTISLWEIIDKLNNFPFPDYKGMVMSLHDACPIREKSDIHKSVRNLLKKMNIHIIETKACKNNSICCGDSFYGELTLEKIHELMKKRAQSMPCSEVVVYCVSCIKSMYIGGKKPMYLLDLLTGQKTEIQEYRTKEWHEQLEYYINEH